MTSWRGRREPWWRQEIRHPHFRPRQTRHELLRQNGIVAGGVIPPDDVAELKAAGVAAVFGPGTPLATSIAFIKEHAPRNRRLKQPGGGA